VLAVICPELPSSSIDERLRDTAAVLKRMSQALVRVASMLWPPEEIGVRLNPLIGLVGTYPTQLAKWQESAAFEGARSVLAALHPGINTSKFVNTILPGSTPSDFFEEVAELARQVACGCDLDVLIE
jgi:hypothetical protein